MARQSETKAHWLARDIRTLVQWLRHDVLAPASPALATRRELFDFVVAELAAREPEDPRRVRPVRVALYNQRDDLLAFAGVLDDKLAAITRAHAISEPLVREACVLHCLPTTSPMYWQGWNRLRAQVGGKFHTLFDAVSRAMADTPRSSALVENLNSRLRTYFTCAAISAAHWCTFGLPGAVLEIGISSGSPSACRDGPGGSPLDGPYETSRTVGAGRPGRTTG